MRRTVVIGVVLLCGGCQHFDPFLPDVSYDRLDLRAISFEHVAVDFVFGVDNPNPLEIDLASYSYRLELEEVPFLSGDNADGFTLEPRGRSELALPLDMVFADIWSTVQATRGEDVVDFAIDGHFGFDTPAGVARLPYDANGGFPALRAPAFSLRRLRLTHLGLSGADLALDIGVDNAHGSSLAFVDFDYGIRLGGEPIAQGSVASFDVDGAAEGTVTLPIAVDLLSVGAAVADAIIGGGRLDVGLDAAVDVDTPFGVVPLAVDVGDVLDLLQ